MAFDFPVYLPAVIVYVGHSKRNVAQVFVLASGDNYWFSWSQIVQDSNRDNIGGFVDFSELSVLTLDRRVAGTPHGEVEFLDVGDSLDGTYLLSKIRQIDWNSSLSVP